jgi:hypothetical protein
MKISNHLMSLAAILAVGAGISSPAAAASVVVNLGGFYTASHTNFTQGQPTYTASGVHNLGNATSITFANINNWFAAPAAGDQSGIPATGQFIQMDNGAHETGPLKGTLNLSGAPVEWEKEWTAGGKFYQEEFTTISSIVRAPTSLTINMTGTLSVWNNCTTDPDSGACGAPSVVQPGVALTLQINQQVNNAGLGTGTISNSFTDLTQSAPGPVPGAGVFGLTSPAALLLAAKSRASRV